MPHAGAGPAFNGDFSMAHKIKLLDTRGGNTKLRKTDKGAAEYRLAGLSLSPDDILCPWRHKAGCAAPCLDTAGRGGFPNVQAARQRKAALWHDDRRAFLAALARELENFQGLCARQGVRGAVRLNVLSDIPWEKHGIPQAFPSLFFYDYTKNASRLGKTPENYRLIFSYSGAPAFRASVRRAQASAAPIAAVFRGPFPSVFLGRRVIDGDASDLANVLAGPVIVGLKAKGRARTSESAFIVDASRLIAAA